MPPERAAALLDAAGHMHGPGAERLRDLLADAAGGGRRVELEAPRGELRELLAVALDEAGEALAGACTGLLRGSGSAADVRSALAATTGLLELLEELERAG